MVDSGKIDWKAMNATQIYNHYRGLTPWPGIWTELEGKRLKLLQISPSPLFLDHGKISVQNKKIFIGTLQESIEVHELQIEGKPPMRAEVFINGHTIDGKMLQ